MQSHKSILFAFILLYPFFLSAQDDPTFFNFREYQANIEADSDYVQLFNTHKIVIASFGDPDSKAKAVYEYHEEQSYKLLTQILLNTTKTGKINYNYLSEHLALNDTQRHELLQIMLKYRGVDDGHRPIITRCPYSPRNAIFFLDESEEIVACIEICFECIGAHLYRTPVVPELYPRAFDVYRPLNIFMAKAGIRFGTLADLLDMMKK